MALAVAGLAGVVAAGLLTAGPTAGPAGGPDAGDAPLLGGAGTRPLAQPSAPLGAGRIDGAGAGDRTVTGWVLGEGPTLVEVSWGATTVAVLADERRLDLELVTSGAGAWGFTVVRRGRPDPVACLHLDGRQLDCAWLDCSELFGRSFARDLRDRFPGQRFTAHVVDTRTDCSYELRPGIRITTASVVKLEILGGLLLDAQRDGRALTGAERRKAEAMMQLSLNPETGALWSELGGVAGMAELDRRFGATDTTHVQPFGATWSTARDRTAVALAVLDGRGPLRWPAVEVAWDIMAGVHPAQQWGISAGVAAGYEVVNKNGFYPMTGYGWRVGSTGFVADPDGGGYAITVMTDKNATQADGVALVEAIAAHVGTVLTAGVPADRPFDEVECITHTGGRTWEALALELGLPASRADDVRRAAGGDGPLSGQLVCTPA